MPTTSPPGQLRQYVAGSASRIHARNGWPWPAVSSNGCCWPGCEACAPTITPSSARPGGFRPMCRLCMARRGIHEPVYCALAPHVTACQRHQLWIGPPASTLDDQKCLHDNAFVLAAARLHERLGRRFGDPVIRSRIREARQFLTYCAKCEHRAANNGSTTIASARSTTESPIDRARRTRTSPKEMPGASCLDGSRRRG